MNDALFLSALGSLAGVIGILWKINLSNTQKIEKRADNIEKKHDQATGRMMEMSEQIGRLEGEVGLAKKVVPMIEDLHADFLEVYPKNKKEDQ